MDLFYLLALTSSSKPISIKELGAFEIKQTRSKDLLNSLMILLRYKHKR